MDQNEKVIEVSLLDGSVGFAVHPKENCPHFNLDNLEQLSKFAEENRKTLFQKPCSSCQDNRENWVCLTCLEIKCSRMIKEHMVEHNQETKHPIVISLSDLSYWCYDCQSYITNPALEKASRFFSTIKFETTEEDQNEKVQVKQLIETFTNLKVTDEEEFTYNKLVEGLRNKKFTRICILAGAGMSVAAGIPDFRTPGTGLYSQIEKYNLPTPEAVFDIEYFKSNPEAFYCVAKEFLLTFDAKPTQAHKFIKVLDQRNQLLNCFTQNIDGLELDAGVDEAKVVQAHGHMRTARCLSCKEEAPIKDFMNHIKNGEIHRCTKCKALIKPDVVFFGEGLPKQFFQQWPSLKLADLVFVIGTSLKVMPFAASVQLVGKKVPCVVLDRDNVLGGRKNTLHLPGDIQQNCQKLLQDLK